MFLKPFDHAVEGGEELAPEAQAFMRHSDELVHSAVSRHVRQHEFTRQVLGRREEVRNPTADVSNQLCGDNVSGVARYKQD